MSLHVHRTGDRLLEALKAASGSYYATFARSTLDPDLLREIDAVARTHGHQDLTTVARLRPAAEHLLREFFDRAARGDPDSRFSYSSRVLLAVPNYPDVALVFLLRALNAADPQTTVHALIEDTWQAQLAHYEFEGGARPGYRPGWRRSLARGARSLARRFFVKPAAPGCDVLLFTLGDNPARNATDAYFGDLAKTLAEQCRVITVYLAPGVRTRFRQRAAALPLETFLTPADALHAWTAARTRDYYSASESPDDALIAYLRAREHASGDVFMQGLMASMFERMLATLKPATLVYPFENRNWEKKLLGAARRQGVRCVGYQHSSITPRHLALSDNAGLAEPGALPDEIVTCGEITAELIAARMPQARARVRVGTALRAQRLALASPEAWGVLAPISSSRAEAWEILRLLHELGSDSTTPIVVRTHPTIPIDDLYAQFRWPAHVRLSRNRSLTDDFAATSLVAYSSSTVALEGMLYGRLPVFLDIGDIPSGNPIHGEHDFLFRAATGPELREILEQIRDFTTAQLAGLREQARAYAERYLVESTPANIQRMADAICRC